MYASRDELEVLEYWGKKQIFKKLQEKNKGKKKFSFIDGPITANNPMGVHHAWGRTYKDLYQRFKAMQGYDQRYQNGFDCQGLWVEVEVEKDLNFNSKKDIERFGLEKFSNTCKERVNKFSKIQTEQSIRLGQWMDWDNSYYTMSDNNIEHIWYFLKKCKEMGWLYKGSKIMPWCIRCGSSSSKHEMSDGGYADLTHTSVYFLFKLKNKDEYLIIWSTTPWTFSSNVAAAINPELNYSQVRYNGKIYYLAESMLKRIIHDDYLVLDTIKGSNMIGWEYEAPYDDFDVQKDVNHKIIPWEEVGADIGTGIVHIAPGCGEEDFELGKKYGLPALSPLNEDGTFRDGYGWQTNRFVWDVNKQVLDDLKKKNAFFSIEQITHRYPICWRCKEELVFRMVSEWFISADQIRPMMLMNIKKVKWEPDYCQKLMEDWITNMEDWCISRKRYWGLPLPIWECNCGEIKVFESLKDLRAKAIDKTKVDKLPEVHRPWIDEILIKCEKCGNDVKRIPDVGDAWLDAGIVPLSTVESYLKDREKWKKWYPVDFICENMPGQYRGWFNALMWASVTITGKAPFKSILGYETLKDEKGEEMHKSKGNAIWFDEAVNKIGADPMRLLYCLQDPSQELRFGYNTLKEPNSSINILYNLSNLVDNKNGKIAKLEDKWIISRLNSLINEVTRHFENLNPHLATRALQNFWLNDLSRGYIQFTRERMNADDKNVKCAVKEVYLILLKLTAPILPFTTEKLWQDLKLKIPQLEESIHLTSWPKADKKKINEKLEEQISLAKQVIESGMAIRDKEKINVRWPLLKAVVYADNKEMQKQIEKVSSIIIQQLNVKKLEINSRNNKQIENTLIFNHGSITLDTKLTKELEEEGYSREMMRRIQALRKEAGLKKQDKIELFIEFEINIKNYSKQIGEKCGAEKLVFNKSNAEHKAKGDIKNKKFEIGLNKI